MINSISNNSNIFFGGFKSKEERQKARDEKLYIELQESAIARITEIILCI